MHTELKSMMAALPSVCVTAVKDAIEDAGIAAGNVTQSFLQTALSQIINNALDQRGITANAVSTAAAAVPTQGGYKVFHWSDGSIATHYLPEGYQLAKLNFSLASNLWFRGHSARGIRPLHVIVSSGRACDFAGSLGKNARRKHQKLLADWRGVFRAAKELAGEEHATLFSANVDDAAPSTADVRAMVDKVLPKMQLLVTEEIVAKAKQGTKRKRQQNADYSMGTLARNVTPKRRVKHRAALERSISAATHG